MAKRRRWHPDPDIDGPVRQPRLDDDEFIEPRLVLREPTSRDLDAVQSRLIVDDEWGRSDMVSIEIDERPLNISGHRSSSRELLPPTRSSSSEVRVDDRSRPPSAPEDRTSPYRPDSVLDGWDAVGLRFRAASVRGPRHRKQGLARQDDFAVRLHEGAKTMVFAIADGVSAAPLSHLGATVAARSAVDDVVSQLDGQSKVSWSRVFETASWSVQELADRREGKANVQSAQRLYATTLTVAVASTRYGAIEIESLTVGDSGGVVVGQSGERTIFGGLRKSSQSTFVNETDALPRIPRNARPVRLRLPSSSILLLGTDGALRSWLSGSGPDIGSALRDSRSVISLIDFAWFVDECASGSGDDATLLMISSEPPSRD
jgi:hypothetical protein